MYYFPHHLVTSEFNTTVRFRVVFNGKTKTIINVSFDENLIVGPGIQQENFFILLRFHTQNIDINIDVAKLFCQIKIFPDDQDFQWIIWKNKILYDTNDYRHSSVTYELL